MADPRAPFAAQMTKPPTRLRRITLTDFRSYQRADLVLDGRPVFLFGPNGAGKTNLLEAVSLLSPGRGLRGAAIAEVGRRQPGEAQGRAWSVAAEMDGEDEPLRLGTGTEAPGAARRVARVTIRRRSSIRSRRWWSTSGATTTRATTPRGPAPGRRRRPAPGCATAGPGRGDGPWPPPVRGSRESDRPRSSSRCQPPAPPPAARMQSGTASGSGDRDGAPVAQRAKSAAGTGCGAGAVGTVSHTQARST